LPEQGEHENAHRRDQINGVVAEPIVKQIAQAPIRRNDG
jgi:hypothetical protein